MKVVTTDFYANSILDKCSLLHYNDNSKKLNSILHRLKQLMPLINRRQNQQKDEAIMNKVTKILVGFVIIILPSTIFAQNNNSTPVTPICTLRVACSGLVNTLSGKKKYKSVGYATVPGQLASRGNDLKCVPIGHNFDSWFGYATAPNVKEYCSDQVPRCRTEVNCQATYDYYW